MQGIQVVAAHGKRLKLLTDNQDPHPNIISSNICNGAVGPRDKVHVHSKGSTPPIVN